MSEFLIYFKQDDQGCGYTIGCGLKVIKTKAESVEHAILWLKDYLTEDGGMFYNDEIKLESITIYEIASTTVIPVAQWKGEFMLSQQVTKEEQEERKMYEKLKEKYGW